jgi:hypothetical protein
LEENNTFLFGVKGGGGVFLHQQRRAPNMTCETYKENVRVSYVFLKKASRKNTPKTLP